MFKKLSSSALFVLFVFAFVFVGCSKDPDPKLEDPDFELDATNPPSLIDQGGTLQVEIIIPNNSGVGLKASAEDMAEAMKAITGARSAAAVREGDLAVSQTRSVILVQVSQGYDAELGDQGYALYSGKLSTHRMGVRVRARTQIGAMYGLYHVIADLGVRYHHPEETFFPSRPAATLPWAYDETPNTPHYEIRGFHEHTQHPTVMSDYYLRPSPEYRPYVSNYIRWFARNRQNAMSWHMLKTVEIEGWLPYIEDIIEEAHGYGIKVGMVLSFVDEQQNNFKIVDPDRLDPESGESIPPLEQIEKVLTEFSDRGFDFYAFQIGSSEFTKPDEEEMVIWLNTATNLLKDRDKPVSAYAWIHTTCSLKAEDGTYYYHLPERATPDLGAWLHTTMFYTLDLPAPVYDCEDFSHNIDFMDRNHEVREHIYFPETAWWLGFDNNTPITLPVTGWSREHDIRNVLSGFNVNGHITFTTGREWMYWQYDHFLMGATWDAEFTWEDYLDWIAPMYGEHGETLVDVIKDWTELQVQHFYYDNPLIYFYVAGELRQDEIGEQAGIAARRPKVAYQDVVAMSNAEFEAWKTNDYEMLERMRVEYGALFEKLEASNARRSTLEGRLYHEAYVTHDIYVRRLDHSLALYGAVQKVREYVQLRRAAVENEVEVDDAIRQGLLADAVSLLATAQGISNDVIALIADIERLYRYPVDILAREKPESLTIYPFGYLYETHTGHFWTRRDEQLDRLIAINFETIPEEWDLEPELLFVSDKAQTRVTKPASPLAQSVLSSMVPQMLFGLNGVEEAGDDTLIVAQDYNENLKPDLDTEAALTVTRDGRTWSGLLASYDLIVHDSTGFPMGSLVLLDSAVSLEFSEEGDGFQHGEVEFDGEVNSHALVQMVVNVGGIDYDGASSLVKQVFAIPRSQPLPPRLSVAFEFVVER
ncbi:MAG: hypothetical protein ACNA8W_07070 [Bradymonadaceae bacterium]